MAGTALRRYGGVEHGDGTRLLELLAAAVGEQQLEGLVGFDGFVDESLDRDRARAVLAVVPAQLSVDGGDYAVVGIAGGTVRGGEGGDERAAGSAGAGDDDVEPVAFDHRTAGADEGGGTGRRRNGRVEDRDRAGALGRIVAVVDELQSEDLVGFDGFVDESLDRDDALYRSRRRPRTVVHHRGRRRGSRRCRRSRSRRRTWRSGCRRRRRCGKRRASRVVPSRSEPVALANVVVPLSGGGTSSTVMVLVRAGSSASPSSTSRSAKGLVEFDQRVGQRFDGDGARVVLAVGPAQLSFLRRDEAGSRRRRRCRSRELRRRSATRSCRRCG